MPTMAEASIPPATPVPTARRLSIEAPVATTSGSKPPMNAKLVIMTARKRSPAPPIAASMIDSPSSRRALANSTIRMAFFAASAISTTKPICA